MLETKKAKALLALPVAVACMFSTAVVAANESTVQTSSRHGPPSQQEQEATDREQIGSLLKAYFDLLDGQNSLLVRSQGPFSLDDYQRDGLDLYVRQLDRWRWQEIQSMPEPRYRPLNVQAQTEARNFLMYCDFANAGKALNRFLSIMIDREYQFSFGDLDFDSLWPFLVEADGSETTFKILEKLIAKALSTTKESGRQDADTTFAQRLLLHEIALLEQQNDPRMMVSADRLYGIRARSRDMPSLYKQTLGSFFARHGQYVKAQQCFSEALSSNQKSYATNRNGYFLFSIVYDYYKMSEIARQIGKLNESIEFAQRAKEALLKAQTMHLQISLAEDLQVPTLNEIDGQIARLTNTSGASKQPRYVEKIESNQRSWYRLFHQLDKAIDEGDLSTAEYLTDKLIVLFDSYGMTPAMRFHLSWADSFLQIARRLSDKSQLSLSNKLLNKLNGTMLKNRWQLRARPFVVAELLINQKRGGTKPDYKALYESMHMVDSDIDKLRWIALLYSGAGYQERALFYFDQALALAAVPKNVGMNSSPEDETTRVMLLLDAAACYANSGNFARGQELAKQALAKVSRSKIDRSEVKWSTYNKFYQCKLLNYGKVMIAAKKYSEIESVLLAAQSAGKSALLDSALGEVYYRSGHPTKALPLLKTAANFYQHSSYYGPVALYLLYADCAAACGDFKDAAIAYRDVADSAPQEPWRAAYDDSGVVERYFRKAVDCANKAKDFDPIQKQHMLVTLSSLTGNEAPDKKLKILLEAYKLLPESDSEKSSVARVIADLAARGQFKLLENIKAAAQLQIDMLYQIAQAVQKQNPSYSGSAWLELAKVEFRQNRWGEAREHFTKAIENSNEWCMRDGCPLICDWDVANYPIELGAAGDTAYKRGREILVLASRRIRQIYACKSSNVSLQEAQTLLYDLRHRRYRDADNELEQLLSTNLLSYYDAEEIYKNGVDAVIEEVGNLDESYSAVALKILNRILDTQKRDLASDDVHCVSTYAAIGKVYKRARQYPQALESFKKSVALQDLYGNFHNYDATQGIAEILRKLGDEAGAIEAQRIVDLTELPNRVQISEQGTIAATDQSLALSEYHILAGKCPYSARCDALLDALIKSTRDSNDQDLTISLLKARLEIARRIAYPRNDIFAQTKLGIRLDLYRQLVGAYLKKGDAVCAQNYAAESLLNIYRTRDLPLLTALAKIQLAAGNRDMATKLAQEATDLPVEKLKAYPGTEDLQQIWQDLGDTAKADKLKAITNS